MREQCGSLAGLRIRRNAKDDPDDLDGQCGTVSTWDERARFSASIYILDAALQLSIGDLEGFAARLADGAKVDLRLGIEPQNYLHAQLNVAPLARIQVQVLIRDVVERYERRTKVREVRLHFRSEPALLDNFLRQLRQLAAGSADRAQLDGLPSD